MILVGLGTQIGARIRNSSARKKCEKGMGEFLSRQYKGRTIDYVKLPYKDGQMTLSQIKKNGFVLYERIKGNSSRFSFKAAGTALFKLLTGGVKL